MTSTFDEFRISVTIKRGLVTQLRVKERDEDGNYVAIDRPWKQQDLTNVRKGCKALNLLAKGVADVEDIVRIVNAPRRARENSKPVALGSSSEFSPPRKRKRR
jgi:hypothetical protein